MRFPSGNRRLTTKEVRHFFNFGCVCPLLYCWGREVTHALHQALALDTLVRSTTKQGVQWSISQPSSVNAPSLFTLRKKHLNFLVNPQGNCPLMPLQLSRQHCLDRNCDKDWQEKGIPQSECLFCTFLMLNTASRFCPLFH